MHSNNIVNHWIYRLQKCWENYYGLHIKKKSGKYFSKYRHEVSILYGMICFGDANLQFVDFDNENHCSYRLHIVVTLYGMR